MDESECLTMRPLTNVPQIEDFDQDRQMDQLSDQEKYEALDNSQNSSLDLQASQNSNQGISKVVNVKNLQK